MVPADEFELIRRYFSPAVTRADVLTGVGDDGAIVRPPPDTDLVLVTDTLVAGVHFPSSMPPRAVGYRAMAVNLSDLAAMGAMPAWALLALTLPAAEAPWLAEFTAGLLELARRYDVALVGGDTTAGPLCVTVQLCGFVPAGGGLLRGGAHPGDRVFVSGTLGDAAAGLQQFEDEPPASPAVRQLRERFLRPQPRVALGLVLRGVASAAIDVSDGLVQDAGHLARASGVGLELEEARIPLSAALRESSLNAVQAALSGGDDYELCFTVPAGRLAALQKAVADAGVTVTEIGRVVTGEGVRVRDAHGNQRATPAGYRHFAGGRTR